MIRAALIDIGNVLKPFSHPRMCEQLAALAGVTPQRMRTEFLETGLFDDFERGLVTTHDVHAWFCRHFGVSPSVDDVRVACSDIFEAEPLWPPLLDALRLQGVRLVALSNTCDWHVRWMTDTDVVLQRLDEITTSWQVGQRKPHHDIYAAAIAKAGCRPDECLYLDDIEQYVAAGRSHGINAHLYVDVPTTVELLRAEGCDPFAPVADAPTVIRPARPRDSLGAAAAWHLAMQVGYREIFPPNGPDVSIGRLAAYWAHTGQNPQVHQFVADSAGIVVGTVLLHVDAEGTTGKLQRLMVHPRAWGTGLGRRLHDTVVDRARQLGLGSLTLDVLHDNHRARTMYERHGWTAVPGTLRPIPDAVDGTPLMLDYQLLL